MNEARIVNSKNVLVLLSGEAADLVGFLGSVATVDQATSTDSDFAGKTVYLFGNADRAETLQSKLDSAEQVFLVRNESEDIDMEKEFPWPSVDVGRVPVDVAGVGVFYPKFFGEQVDYFAQIQQEHNFQSLTESTKPDKALRTGIYLTPVEKIEACLHFRLLRCSTNLSGPTENFRNTDDNIVDALNTEAAAIFENFTPLNHVLAQIYHNSGASAEQKQRKAKIGSHADKTKDMPERAIMAFCTFYDGLDKLERLSDVPYDYGINGTSGMTRLKFRLKADVDHEKSLPARFSVTLFPNSVFFMPLSTNRFYTHEVKASALDAARLPTRMGYVVRCSDSEAVHRDNQTFLRQSDDLVALEPPTEEGMNELRRLYAEENKTSKEVDYQHKFLFSMNEGDYREPVF